MCATCGCTAAREDAPVLSKDVLDSIAEGEIQGFTFDEHAVAIARTGGELFALNDECTHAACPLSEGEIEGDEVICSCHGSRFDVRTGDVIAGPADEPVATYDIVFEGDEVHLKLS